MVQKPSWLPGQNLRPPVSPEPPESCLTMVAGSNSSRKQDEQPSSAKSHVETGSTSTDSLLKQRELHRNKQVVRERFDEWEEAYRLEAERRKVDEMLMREALIEAKEAGDMWEVPVGAVLVHDGKIIARGCNLVEELRDSTAHAEMTCIGNASKVLRSWRLADTTLYVTLEPWPMRAGAILQARINTLVWGGVLPIGSSEQMAAGSGCSQGAKGMDQSHQTSHRLQSIPSTQKWQYGEVFSNQNVRRQCSNSFSFGEGRKTRHQTRIQIFLLLAIIIIILRSSSTRCIRSYPSSVCRRL